METKIKLGSKKDKMKKEIDWQSPQNIEDYTDGKNHRPASFEDVVEIVRTINFSKNHTADLPISFIKCAFCDNIPARIEYVADATPPINVHALWCESCHQKIIHILAERYKLNSNDISTRLEEAIKERDKIQQRDAQDQEECRDKDDDDDIF